MTRRLWLAWAVAMLVGIVAISYGMALLGEPQSLWLWGLFGAL